MPKGHGYRLSGCSVLLRSLLKTYAELNLNTQIRLPGMNFFRALYLTMVALVLSGCIPDVTSRFLEVERINNAYLVAGAHLVVCVDGWLDHVPESMDEKKKTIFIPNTSEGLKALKSATITYPQSHEILTQSADVQFREYRLDPTWIRRGCVAKDVPATWKEVSVVNGIVSHRTIPGSNTGTIYLLKSRNSADQDTLIYEAKDMSLGTTNRTAFALQWKEQHVDVLATLTSPIWAPLAAYAGGSVTLAEKLSSASNANQQPKRLTDEAKMDLAKQAAATYRCRGKISETNEEPKMWDDPTERSYIVRCGKAEMKVYCRYHETRVNECFTKWVD